MVANPKPWKTLRLSRARLAIVGCGDVGLRLLAHLSGRVKCVVLGRSNAIVKAAHPNTPCLSIDLDDRRSLSRIRSIAPWLVYLAPPPARGLDDPRMKRFLACTASVCRRTTPTHLHVTQTAYTRCVYVSTTGVYGAAHGAWVKETSPMTRSEPRGLRRVAAEQRLSRSNLAHTTVLRAPGIYARDRLPLERIKQGLPAFIEADDVPTNHIHADDLARLCWLGLFRGRNRRNYNAADGQPMMHADYLSAVAKQFDLAAPPRLAAEQVKAALSPIAWSMLSGARRVSSQRLLTEWPVHLKYPSMQHFLETIHRPKIDAPIGVFDSGMGGLSVLRDLCAALPHEQFTYFADSFHAPYGEKGDDFVRERSLVITQQLRATHAIKALVVACNTATAAAIADIRTAHPDLIVIGIEPALKPAAAASRSHHVAVFATHGTLASQKFQTLKSQQTAHAQTQYQCVPCDGLAEAIERHSDHLNHPSVAALVQQYCAVLAHQPKIDTVVLGCTHYPLVKALFRSFLPDAITIIDNGNAVAKRLSEQLQAAGMSLGNSGGNFTGMSAGLPLSAVQLSSSGDQQATRLLQALWVKLHHD